MFEKFSDYMWHLIHYPLRAKKTASNIYILFVVLGKLFDEVKEIALQLPRQANIKTATGKYLDLCGNDRNMPRLQNEDDESYRRRQLLKVEIARRAGTKQGMELALKSLGYDVEIEPMYLEDKERWAEFYIILKEKETNEVYDFSVIKSTVMEIKQASAKPNYGIRFVFENDERVQNSLRACITNIFTINFFNSIPLNLDGTWQLDDEYKLNGLKTEDKKTEYMRLSIKTKIKNTSEVNVQVTVNTLWYLDGEYALDGEKKLNAIVESEEV